MQRSVARRSIAQRSTEDDQRAPAQLREPAGFRQPHTPPPPTLGPLSPFRRPLFLPFVAFRLARAMAARRAALRCCSTTRACTARGSCGRRQRARGEVGLWHSRLWSCPQLAEAGAALQCEPQRAPSVQPRTMPPFMYLLELF